MWATPHQTPGPAGDVQAARGVFQSNAALAEAVCGLGKAIRQVSPDSAFYGQLRKLDGRSSAAAT